MNARCHKMQKWRCLAYYAKEIWLFVTSKLIPGFKNTAGGKHSGQDIEQWYPATVTL